MKMLKWLQTGVYHNDAFSFGGGGGSIRSNKNNQISDVITDDPLATLNFKDEELKTTSAFKPCPVHTEIYSVSR